MAGYIPFGSSKLFTMVAPQQTSKNNSPLPVPNFLFQRLHHFDVFIQCRRDIAFKSKTGQSLGGFFLVIRRERLLQQGMDQTLEHVEMTVQHTAVFTRGPDHIGASNFIPSLPPFGSIE